MGVVGLHFGAQLQFGSIHGIMGRGCRGVGQTFRQIKIILATSPPALTLPILAVS